MTEAKEVAKKEANEVGMPTGAWGAADNIGADEVSLSKILLMQPLSELVSDDKAVAGEFRDSSSGALLGDGKKPMEIQIIHRYLTWTIFENGKYSKTIPVTDENRNWSYFGDDGTTRSKTFNFYCVSPSDSTRVPRVMSLKNMAASCARSIQTYFMELGAQDKPSASVVLSFTSEKQKNDKGTYHVPTFSIARDATADELANAYEKYQFVRKLEQANKIVVADEDEVVVNASTDDVPF